MWKREEVLCLETNQFPVLFAAISNDLKDFVAEQVTEGVYRCN